jgi:restriction system protein
VRELYGVLTAEKAAKAIFVTTGIYTREAQDFAKEKPIELIDGEALARLIAPIQGQISVNPLDEGALRVPSSSASTVAEAPACPICRREMVLRTARKGANSGSQFWGCPDYPKCKGTRGG